MANEWNYKNWYHCYRIVDGKVQYCKIPYESIIPNLKDLDSTEISIACSELNIPGNYPRRDIDKVRVVEYWNEYSTEYMKLAINCHTRRNLGFR